MFRNALAAALRNLSRNRAYTAINILGLTFAFAAVLVITLFLRDEFEYDRFVPGYKSIYRIAILGTPREGAQMRFDLGNADLATRLQSALPEVESVARLKSIQLGVDRGNVEYMEELYWADPTFFSVLPLRAWAGDLQTALNAPGSVVITRRIARKYFGREDVIGQTLTIRRRQTLTVTAVLDDLPSNTHLSGEIFASGRASYSALSIFDAQPSGPSQYAAQVFTYLRVRQGVSDEMLDAALQRFVSAHPLDTAWGTYVPHAVPLRSIHFEPAGLGAMKPSGSLQTLRALSAISALILAMAAINFGSLMTISARRRAVEAGVRKAAGAGRVHVALQFISEALLHVAIALLLAIALVEVSLPHLNALLDWNVQFQYVQHSGFLLALVATAMLMGVLAAICPAWVLSGVRPRTVLYGVSQTTGFGWVRQSLIAVQFAILIGLILSTIVIRQQTDFAVNERLRVPTDQVVMIRTSCGDAFRDELLRLPGVEKAACSALSLQNISITTAAFHKPDGGDLTLRMTAIDEGLFELFGLRAMAGRFFSRQRSTDRFPDGYDGNGFVSNGPQPPVAAAVINESAARRLASTPAAALGKVLRMEGEGGNAVFEVIGVAPDLAVDSTRELVQPTIYYFAPKQFGLLTVRLAGHGLPETLAAIGQAWKKVGEPRPLEMVFLDRYVALLHEDILRQAAASSCFSLVAVVIACLGLLGLSVSLAEHRTREIGIRKAMGADTGDVLRLLLWQFSKPVLWANLLAWPIAGWAMQRWLAGFAYHVDLPLWLFPAAALTTLLIALATVSAHALRVARAKPVTALRYE